MFFLSGVYILARVLPLSHQDRLDGVGNVHKYNRHTADCDHRGLSRRDDPHTNCPQEKKHSHSS